MNMGQFFILILILVVFFMGSYFVLTMYESDQKYKDFFYGFQDENISGVQFYPNMRYREDTITYGIESACSESKRNTIESALKIIQDRTILTFKEDSQNPEIRYFCSNIAPKPDEETHFIAGEGGPSEIINASSFSVIISGKVSLFREEKCSTPLVAIHETFHALGFDHSKNPKSVMYSVTECKQEIDQYIINKIEDLYSIQSAPDLVIEKATANKDGRLLTFEITVSNFGLKDSQSAELVVYADGEPAKVFDLDETKIGVRKVISVENLMLPLRSNTIIFKVETSEPEISKENNAVELVSE